jgi:hypothetical protein
LFNNDNLKLEKAQHYQFSQHDKFTKNSAYCVVNGAINSPNKMTIKININPAFTAFLEICIHSDKALFDNDNLKLEKAQHYQFSQHDKFTKTR